MKYFTPSVFWRTLAVRLFRWSDVARWADTSAYDADWAPRTTLIGGLVPPGSRVIEFGAGGRGLEKVLHPSCSYTPSDLVSRGDDTLVLDLNGRLPELEGSPFDVAVLAGVLEYVVDLGRLFAWLHRHAATCIASYACAQPSASRVVALREASRRLATGWVNSLTEDELKMTMLRAGFRVQSQHVWGTEDGSEIILVAVRR